MSTYNNIKELKNYILKINDIVIFVDNNITYRYTVKEHYGRVYFYHNECGVLINDIKLLSKKVFFTKRIGYYLNDFPGSIYVENLEDLTKITIELFKMCEKLN